MAGIAVDYLLVWFECLGTRSGSITALATGRDRPEAATRPTAPNGPMSSKVRMESRLRRPISSAIRHWLLESTSLPSIEKAYCHSEKLLGWLRGLTSHAETLKNVISLEAQAARQAALDTLKRISDL